MTILGNVPTREVIPMIPTTHADYRDHLSLQIACRQEDAAFMAALDLYAEAVVTLADLSFDPLRDDLAALYCPTGRGAPKDACAMLRSLLLMTLLRESSPDRWALRLRREPALAILAGFPPGQTPCATTHRDMITRIADGHSALRAKQDRTLNETLTGRHEHVFSDTTDAHTAEAEADHTTQSEVLCRRPWPTRPTRPATRTRSRPVSTTCSSIWG